MCACVSPMAMLDFRLIMMFDYNNDCCDCLPDFLSFLCGCVCACVNVCVSDCRLASAAENCLWGWWRCFFLVSHSLFCNLHELENGKKISLNNLRSRIAAVFQ